MNKRTKILLTLLSVATMTAAGAFGLAGCKKGAGNTTPTIQATYESYKAYAEANGQTALSYDEWLKVITAGAKDGADGEDGKDGKPGADGEDGATIDKIVLDEDGNLVITFTNPEMPAQIVPLPEEVTHEHAYDDDEDKINVLIPAKGVESEGLGYYKCQKEGCEHIELVIIREYYKFTCKDEKNNPVAGVKVTVNGATAVSGADGVAKVAGYGKHNDYVVSVNVDGYNVVGTYKTAGKNYDYNVALKEKTSESTPSGDDEYCTAAYSIDKACTLNINLDMNLFGDMWEGDYVADHAELKFNGGSDGKIYRVEVSYSDTYDNMDAALGTVDGMYVSDIGGVKRRDTENKRFVYSYTIIVGANESVIHTLTGSDLSWNPDDLRDFKVEVTAEPLPAVGSIKENPYKLTLGEELTIPSTDGSEVWCAFTFSSAQHSGVRNIEINSASEVDYYKAKMKWDGSWLMVSDAVAINSGNKVQVLSSDADANTEDENMDGLTVYFVVKGSGVRKLTVSEYNPPYSYKKPVEITTLGAVTCADTGIEADDGKWFKYTNNGADAQYLTLVNNNNASQVQACLSTYAQAYQIEPLATVYKSTALAQRSVFKVEAGATVYFYAIAVDGACSFELKEYADATDKGLHADKANTLTVTDNKAKVQFVYANNYNSYYKYTVSGVENTKDLEISDVTNKISITVKNKNTGDSTSSEVSKIAVTNGDELLITLSPRKVTVGTDYELTFTYGTEEVPVTPVDYSVMIQGLPNLAGIEVTLYDGENPVQKDGQPLKATTALVGEQYLAVFTDLVIPKGKTYRAVVAEQDGYEITQTCEFTTSKTDDKKSIVFAKLYEYNITVTLGEGVTADKLAGVKAVIGNKEAALVDGACTLSAVGREPSDNDENPINILTFTGVPAGYSIATLKVSAAGGNVTVTIVKADSSSVGGDNATNVKAGKDTLVIGDNVLNNAQQVGYYKFTAQLGGTYTFSLADGDKGSLYAVEVGSIKIITEGKQTSAACGAVLGSAGHFKPFNKVTLTLSANSVVLIGYDSSVEGASVSALKIEGTPDSGEIVELGANTVTIAAGSATAYFFAPVGSYKIESIPAGVTVKVNGKEYTEGDTISVPAAATYTITLAGADGNASFTISVAEEEGGR